MTLSPRAEAFLAKKERQPHISDREQIVSALQRAELPVFEPVIAFQQNYGGYTFYAGLAPIVFGIIHLEPEFMKPNSIAGEQDEIDRKYYFLCADTLANQWFHIDQDGKFYAEDELSHSSIDKFIESKALWWEITQEGEWQPVSAANSYMSDMQEVLSQFGLDYRLNHIPEASDEYTNWWRSENLCVQARTDALKIWQKTEEAIQPPATRREGSAADTARAWKAAQYQRRVWPFKRKR